MLKNHSLAKYIHQVGWGSFMTMLKYKAEQEGKVYLEIERFFPSSKTCSNCLNVVDSLPLDIRTWTCDSCGTEHAPQSGTFGERDINADLIIRDEGMRIISSEGTKPTVQM